MIEGWPEKIHAAQNQPKVLIGGVLFDRVRYGDERDDWGADQHGCHDCRVIKGQVHVRGCDAEQCPNCGGQLIGCDCDVADCTDLTMRWSERRTVPGPHFKITSTQTFRATRGLVRRRSSCSR